ncbi:MAG: hypothetical protein VKL60_20875 [Sphaerospermopsis sp.]|nr:hypothetical protein [Sphaerospermopsis sp.]
MAKVKNTNGSPQLEESQLVPSVDQVEEKEVIHEVEVNFTTESKPFINPNDVEFLVKYSEYFKGKKIMPEGITIVSKETAEMFEARGMGNRVK